MYLQLAKYCIAMGDVRLHPLELTNSELKEQFEVVRQQLIVQWFYRGIKLQQFAT